jgi:hypothetical protein
MMMNVNHSVTDPRSRERKEQGQAASAITLYVSWSQLAPKKTKAPDFMPLEYQLNAVVMRKIPPLWSGKLANGNTRCIFAVSSDEAACKSAPVGLEFVFAWRPAFSGRLW